VPKPFASEPVRHRWWISATPDVTAPAGSTHLAAFCKYQRLGQLVVIWGAGCQIIGGPCPRRLNEAISTVENEATRTDWMGDLGGGLGFDPEPVVDGVPQRQVALGCPAAASPWTASARVASCFVVDTLFLLSGEGLMGRRRISGAAS
jgi:hypothetical protein